MADTQNLPQKYNHRIPIHTIIELAQKNLSHSEIAKIVGCAPSNITQRLQDIEITKKFTINRAFALAHLQRKIYDSITDADLKKASLMQKATAFGVFYDKERLERGESTQNIAYADVIKAKTIRTKDIDDLRAEYPDYAGQFDSDSHMSTKVSSEDSCGLAGDLKCG